MSYEVPIEINALGRVIRAAHQTILSNLVTYLTSSTTAGATSFSVLDNSPIVQNDYVVVGKIGLDKTEILQVTGVVTPGTALTLGVSVYDHGTDAPVTKILWNQVQIFGADTATGSKTLIDTINLQPSRSDTSYINTGTEYNFYFVRYANSFTGSFSDISAAAPANGVTSSVVRTVKKTALEMTNEKVDSTFITDTFLNNEIFNCEQEVWSEKQKWSWAYTFDYIIGQTVEGGYSFSLPADIADPNSEKSILERGVRIGDRVDLQYITKEEWDKFFVLTRHTTLNGSIVIGAATIVLTSVSDLDTSGSIVIGSDNAINYTGVTVATNTLTGVTGVVANHSSGEDVWQNASFTEPNYFTVFSGKLYFQAGVQSTYAGKNVYLSYYKKPVNLTDEVTGAFNDYETLDLPDFTIYHYYLAWKILLRKNNGVTTPESEEMHKLYTERKEILKHIDRTGQRVFMRPRITPIDVPTDQMLVRTSFLRMDS